MYTRASHRIRASSTISIQSSSNEVLTQVGVNDRAGRDVVGREVDVAISQLSRLAYTTVKGYRSNAPHLHLIRRPRCWLEGS